LVVVCSAGNYNALIAVVFPDSVVRNFSFKACGLKSPVGASGDIRYWVIGQRQGLAFEQAGYEK